MNARQSPRWSARLPVRYQVFERASGELTLGPLASCRARDIGPDGLFLAGAALPIGTRVHLFFELPESHGGLVEAFGEVIHDRPRLDTTGYEVAGVGVRLLHLRPRDRARLDCYLAERRAIDTACLSAAAVRARALAHLRRN